MEGILRHISQPLQDEGIQRIELRIHIESHVPGSQGGVLAEQHRQAEGAAGKVLQQAVQVFHALAAGQQAVRIHAQEIRLERGTGPDQLRGVLYAVVFLEIMEDKALVEGGEISRHAHGAHRIFRPFALTGGGEDAGKKELEGKHFLAVIRGQERTAQFQHLGKVRRKVLLKIYEGLGIEALGMGEDLRPYANAVGSGNLFLLGIPKEEMAVISVVNVCIPGFS